MNIEELSKVWNQSITPNNRIEVNESFLKKVTLNTVKSNLREIKWESFIELFVGYFWGYFLIEFILMNFSDFRFSFPAAILLAINIYTVFVETYKLILYYSINNQLSIVEAQRKLEYLKRVELFDINSIYVLIPLFFMPFIIVFAKAFLMLDIYMIGLSEREMLYATGGSFIVAAIIVFFLKRFPNKELKESIEFMNELKEIQLEDDLVPNN